MRRQISLREACPYVVVQRSARVPLEFVLLRKNDVFDAPRILRTDRDRTVWYQNKKKVPNVHSAVLRLDWGDIVYVREYCLDEDDSEHYFVNEKTEIETECVAVDVTIYFLKRTNVPRKVEAIDDYKGTITIEGGFEFDKTRSTRLTLNKLKPGDHADADYFVIPKTFWVSRGKRFGFPSKVDAPRDLKKHARQVGVSYRCWSRIYFHKDGFKRSKFGMGRKEKSRDPDDDDRNLVDIHLLLDQDDLVEVDEADEASDDDESRSDEVSSACTDEDDSEHSQASESRDKENRGERSRSYDRYRHHRRSRSPMSSPDNRRRPESHRSRSRDRYDRRESPEGRRHRSRDCYERRDYSPMPSTSRSKPNRTSEDRRQERPRQSRLPATFSELQRRRRDSEENQKSKSSVSSISEASKDVNHSPSLESTDSSFQDSRPTRKTLLPTPNKHVAVDDIQKELMAVRSNDSKRQETSTTLTSDPVVMNVLQALLGHSSCPTTPKINQTEALHAMLTESGFNIHAPPLESPKELFQKTPSKPKMTLQDPRTAKKVSEAPKEASMEHLIPWLADPALVKDMHKHSLPEQANRAPATAIRKLSVPEAVTESEKMAERKRRFYSDTPTESSKVAQHKRICFDIVPPSTAPVEGSQPFPLPSNSIPVSQASFPPSQFDPVAPNHNENPVHVELANELNTVFSKIQTAKRTKKFDVPPMPAPLPTSQTAVSTFSTASKPVSEPVPARSTAHRASKPISQPEEDVQKSPDSTVPEPPPQKSRNHPETQSPPYEEPSVEPPKKPGEATYDLLAKVLPQLSAYKSITLTKVGSTMVNGVEHAKWAINTVLDTNDLEKAS